MKNVKWKPVSSLFALGLLMSGLFQNCSLVSDLAKTTAATQEKSDGGGAGGTGFDGKPTYVNRASSDVCSDGTLIRARYEFLDALHVVKTRENCADIPATPVDLSQLNLAQYNLDNLISAGQVFDREAPGVGAASLLCRGREPGSAGNSVWQAADVVILKPDLVGSVVRASLKIGWYDSGTGLLRAKAASDQVTLTRTEDVARNQTIYEGKAVISYGGETHTHDLRLEVKRPNGVMVGYITIRFSPTFGANGFRLFESKNSERRSSFYAVADCFLP